MEDLVKFAKDQNAPEANDLNHWDISFWSERLRESKYEINEVHFLSLSLSLMHTREIMHSLCKIEIWSWGLNLI